MNRKEAMRQLDQENVLMELGFTSEEAEKLRRISMTLHRWHELECGDGNGCIERENDDGTGRPFWTSAHTGERSRSPIADRETGAKKRLAAIIGRRNNTEANALTSKGGLSAYIQTDPRGAALYILRLGDVPEGKDADAYYNRGICVY
jgi:hypothetical protein